MRLNLSHLNQLRADLQTTRVRILLRLHLGSGDGGRNPEAGWIADTYPTGVSRFRFESGALRATRSTLRVGVSCPRAEARFAGEARRKAGL
jgi:hypothetical protein